MSRSGCVLLWREMRELEAFQEKPFCPAYAWVWLVMEANWEDKMDRFGELVKRGELHTSQPALSIAWGWHRSRVHRFLGRLETEQRIEQEANNRRTKLRITNYERYQDFKAKREQRREQESNRDPNSEQDTTERSTTKEQKNSTPLIPQEFDNAECREAWQRFLSHRRQLKKPLSTETQRSQLQSWAKKGQVRFLAAIEFTIDKGWQGLREKSEVEETPLFAKKPGSAHEQNLALVAELRAKERETPIEIQGEVLK